MIKDKCQAVKEIGKTELNIWVADTGAAEGALPLTQKVCVKRAETFTKLNE